MDKLHDRLAPGRSVQELFRLADRLQRQAVILNQRVEELCRERDEAINQASTLMELCKLQFRFEECE